MVPAPCCRLLSGLDGTPGAVVDAGKAGFTCIAPFRRVYADHGDIVYRADQFAGATVIAFLINPEPSSL